MLDGHWVNTFRRRKKEEGLMKFVCVLDLKNRAEFVAFGLQKMLDH